MDWLDVLKTTFVPGQFQYLYKAYKETARVTFGGAWSVFPPDMTVAWLDMMNAEFGKLKDKLLTNIQASAFPVMGEPIDLAASHNRQSVESDWARWSAVHSEERRKLTYEAMLLYPSVVWDALLRLAIGMDAVATNEKIPPVDTGEALAYGAKLASDAGKKVIDEAAGLVSGGFGALRDTLYILAGIAVAGVVAYAVIKE